MYAKANITATMMMRCVVLAFSPSSPIILNSSLVYVYADLAIVSRI